MTRNGNLKKKNNTIDLPSSPIPETESFIKSPSVLTPSVTQFDTQMKTQNTTIENLPKDDNLTEEGNQLLRTLFKPTIHIENK